MRIYFTRHGESQANLLHVISNRDLPHGLTEKGRAQAASLADQLSKYPITRIYSSPVPRAVETSGLVAQRLGLEVEVTDALREFDCGIAEGHSDEAAWQLWRELVDDWMQRGLHERRIEGGESFNDVRDRFISFVESLIQKYKGTDTGVVCVSHGGTYFMMLPLVLRNITDELVQRYKIGYTTCIVAEWQSCSDETHGTREAGLNCIEWNGMKLLGG